MLKQVDCVLEVRDARAGAQPLRGGSVSDLGVGAARLRHLRRRDACKQEVVKACHACLASRRGRWRVVSTTHRTPKCPFLPPMLLLSS
jgi:hypothetical protein